MTSIAIVIVTFQGRDLIGPLLQSALESAPSATVIVVDNASTDGTPEVIRDNFPDVVLIQLENNLGFGVGNNVGIAYALRAGCTYIYLVNQDGIIPPDSINALCDFMEGHLEFGVATPVHCSPDLTRLDQKSFTGYLGPYGHTYLSDAALGRPLSAFYRIRGINAAAWFVRASVFEKVGGFDPIFFMYGEDDDLIARFEYHEVAFALVPSARFIHLRQPSLHRAQNSLQRFSREQRTTYSTLLARVKRPGTSPSFAISIILSHGVLRPLADFLIKRGSTTLLSHWLASLRLIANLPKAFRHMRICEAPGPHFLNTFPCATERPAPNKAQPREGPERSNSEVQPYPDSKNSTYTLPR